MKTINGSKYKLVLSNEYGYVFQSNHTKDEDIEWVVVSQARVINPDGTVSYYHRKKMADRMRTYNHLISDMLIRRKDQSSSSDERVRLTHVQRPTHSPKRIVAGINEPVKTKVVSRKKMVSTMN